MLDIYPPPRPEPFSFRDYTHLEEDLAEQPFGEHVFWSRRILSEPLVLTSKYTLEAFLSAHPIAKKGHILEVYERYSEWKKEQPSEGDLTTKFGHQMFDWFEAHPQVQEQFRVAYSTLGWYLCNKMKSIAHRKMEGKSPILNWGHLFRVRSMFSQIDHALFRMGVHNAGVWELDGELAEEIHWVQMLWVFARQEKVEFNQFYTTWDHLQVDAPDQWWYAGVSKYDIQMIPDELDAFYENGLLSIPLGDVLFQQQLQQI